MTEWTPISLDKVKTYPLKERGSKVNIEHFGKPWRPGGHLGQWLRFLPRILAGNDLLQIVARIVRAVSSQKNIILAMVPQREILTRVFLSYNPAPRK